MIMRSFGKLSARLRARRLRGSIDNALAGNRYEVRSDGLLLVGTSFRLAITWRARGIHSEWMVMIRGPSKNAPG
jgi:hypothetical protein